MKRRYVYRTDDNGNVHAIEVGEGYTGAERRAPIATEAITYAAGVAPDGSDISTRKKHREYLKRNNYAMMTDYTNYWAKCAAERAEGTPAQRAELRHTIGRTMHELRSKNGR